MRCHILRRTEVDGLHFDELLWKGPISGSHIGVAVHFDLGGTVEAMPDVQVC